MHGLLELLGCLFADGVALGDKALAHLGLLEHVVDRQIELLDDDRVRALGREDAEPDGAVEALGAWQAAGCNGGHFLDGFHGLGRGHAQQAHLAGLVVAQHGLHLVHDAAGLAAQHRGDGFGAALVGHMHHVQAQTRVELGKRHMGACAIAGGGIVVLAGMGLDLVNELLEVLDVDHIGIDGQHIGHVHQRSDGHEVGLHVERQFLVERGIAAMGGGGAEVDGVAIGLGTGHELAADIAGGAALVVNDDGLAQNLAQGLLRHAADHIHTRSGVKAHDHGDGLVRIAGGAGVGRLAGQGKQGGGRCCGNKTGDETGQQTHDGTCPEEP